MSGSCPWSPAWPNCSHGWNKWHTEADTLYGGESPADFFREHLDSRARQVGRTLTQLAAWRPTPARRGRGRARPALGS
jgi:hypothetical protein